MNLSTEQLNLYR